MNSILKAPRIVTSAVLAPRLFTLLAMILFIPESKGQATFYSTLAAWSGAATNPTLVATFSEAIWMPINTPLAGNWTLNGVTYSGHAGTPFPNIFVITSSTRLTGNALTANGDENIDLVLSPPRTAFGFDAAVNRFGPVVVKVFDTSGQQIGATSLAAGLTGFIGCTSTVPIGRVNFLSDQGAIEDSLLDNVRLGDACVGPSLTQGPFSALTCLHSQTPFSVVASGTGPLNYQWQIQLPSNAWSTLGNDPFPLPCGGFAYAIPPRAASTSIGISPCDGILTYHIRCVVSNACGSVTSDPVDLTICIGDFNCDGGIDGQDVGAFFTAWQAGSSTADVNFDGGVDGADVAAFFEHWENGC